jgi:hypothetical protein
MGQDQNCRNVQGFINVTRTIHLMTEVQATPEITGFLDFFHRLVF